MTVTAYSVYRNDMHKMEAYPLDDYEFYFVMTLTCDTLDRDVKLKMNQNQFNKLCELLDEYRALNLITR